MIRTKYSITQNCILSNRLNINFGKKLLTIGPLYFQNLPPPNFAALAVSYSLFIGNFGPPCTLLPMYKLAAEFYCNSKLHK